jgi:hypothetical protein
MYFVQTKCGNAEIFVENNNLPSLMLARITSLQGPIKTEEQAW